MISKYPLWVLYQLLDFVVIPTRKEHLLYYFIFCKLDSTSKFRYFGGLSDRKAGQLCVMGMKFVED